MKKRFIAIFLAGGLMLGLCGCGDSRSEAMPAPAVEDMNASEIYESETATVEEFDGKVDEEVEEKVIDETPTDATIDEAEPTSEPEAATAPANADLSEIMTSHMLEYEDLDGYQMQETVRLSPIFRESDMDALVATWEALGGSADEIPVGDECYSWDAQLKSCDFNDTQYVIGNREIINRTEGFSLTPDNQHSFPLGIGVETNMDTMPLVVRETVPYCSVTYIFFSDGLVRTKGGVTLGNALMNKNQWGPTRFIIILPSRVTPNFPNGYDYCDLSFQFWASGTLSNDETFCIPYYGD